MSYQPYCPGGKLYIPRNQTGCVACCNTQACSANSGSINGSPTEHFWPASWKMDKIAEVPPQKCNPGSSSYKCFNATQPLIGCCKRNPCSTGFLEADFTPTFIFDTITPSPPSLSTPEVPVSSRTSSSPSPSSSLSSSYSAFPHTGFITSTTDLGSVSTETPGQQATLSTVSTLPESTSSSPNAATLPESASTSSNVAAIAGGVAGGIAGLALLVGLFAICRHRRKIRSQRGIGKGRFSAWNSGQPRSMQPGSAELDEIKQGPSTRKLPLLLHTIILKTNSVFLASLPLPPPSAPPSPLLSPLPPPPAYASYNSHGNGLEGSPDHLHPSSGSPYVSYDVPSPETPPSPPPLKTRLSQQSTASYSDGQDVSPISTHYQNQPFDNPRSMPSSVYSDVSGGVLHAHAM